MLMRQASFMPKNLGLNTEQTGESILTPDLHIIFDVTGDDKVFAALLGSKTCTYCFNTWISRKSTCPLTSGEQHVHKTNSRGNA